jgi:Sedlin, N-terminal conserved region
MSSSSSSVLFVIVGRNEPLYEAEFNKRPGSGDAVTRQNYFVLHSALDLVEKAAWTTSNMYLKVVDKVSPTRLQPKRQKEDCELLFLVRQNQASQSALSTGESSASLNISDRV